MLIVIGLVALITGVNVILGGSASVPGASSAASAVHDNEMRFFAVYWVGFGIFSFWVSRDLESRMGFIPALAAFFFLGGVARLVSIMLVGFPSAPLIGATALELVVPPFLMFFYYKNKSSKEKSG
jgi:hypothetical protein